MRAREGVAGEALALIANPDVRSFRCVMALARLTEEEVILSGETLRRIGVAPGGQVLVAP